MCLTINELHLNAEKQLLSPSLIDWGGLINEIAIQQTYAFGSPYLWKVSGKKENEENQLLQFVHQEGLHLVYEEKIPRHK